MARKQEAGKRGRHSGKRDYFVAVQWPLLSDKLDVSGWPSPEELRRIQRGWEANEPADAVAREIIQQRREHDRSPFADAA